MLERIRNQITELRKEEERRYTYEAEFSFSKELPVQYSEWMKRSAAPAGSGIPQWR